MARPRELTSNEVTGSPLPHGRVPPPASGPAGQLCCGCTGRCGDGEQWEHIAVAGTTLEPRDFLAQNGALYLLATGAGAGASWPLVAAFLEDLTEVARHIAAGSSGARLDPPLLLALDEIGNLAPLPSLPILMTEGGALGSRRCLCSSRSRRRETSGVTRCQHNLGRSDREGDPRRSVCVEGPPRALGTHRRTRRAVRHRHNLRLRRPLPPAVEPTRVRHATRADPHAPVWYRPDHVAQRTAHRDGTSPMDESVSCHTPHTVPALRETSSSPG